MLMVHRNDFYEWKYCIREYHEQRTAYLKKWTTYIKNWNTFWAGIYEAVFFFNKNMFSTFKTSVFYIYFEH